MNIRIFLIILISAAMVGSYGSNGRRNSNTDILAMTVRDTAATDSVQVEDSTEAAQCDGFRSSGRFHGGCAVWNQDVE